MDVTRQLIAALALPAILLITACGSSNTVKNDEGTPASAAANAPMVASLKMNDPGEAAIPKVSTRSNPTRGAGPPATSLRFSKSRLAPPRKAQPSP